MPSILNGPEDLLVRVALLDTRTRVYQSEFRWPALDRLGPNDYGGDYAQVTLRFGACRWSFEMARDGARIFIVVRALDPATAEDVQVRLETLYTRDNGGRILTQEQDVVARRGDRAWRVSSPTVAAHRVGTTIASPLRRPFVAVVEPLAEGVRNESRDAHEVRAGRADAEFTAMEREAFDKVAAARRRYLSKFSYVPKEFWWAYSAIPYGIGWNMIWAADRQEPIQVCSRDWCVHGSYGEWVLFNWDTFLLAPAAADYDRELAKQILRPQFAVQTADGMIPGIACPWGVSGDRAMPPTAALGIWKTYLRSGDRAFVDEFYEPCRRYQDWRSRARDGNKDGLLEWGSHPAPLIHPQWQAHTLWASRYETGMDNHPMWDDVRFNEKTNTQEQSDVGLNALHAANANCLSKMAGLIGKKDDAARFGAEAESLSRRVEEMLWNDATGLWLSRDWNGKWNHRASPCCLYPLFMQKLDPRHVSRAITEHLQNPRRFGGRYVMPVSPRDDPAYPEQYYVRGRIWPEQTMLVHMALRECRQEEAAAQLARGCLETFKQEWVEEGHLHENYHAETADGDDTPESDPLYSFGLMLPQAAWNHLRDVRFDGTEVKADLDVFAGYLDSKDIA
jgi:glycogen debranching enzyme